MEIRVNCDNCRGGGAVECPQCHGEGKDSNGNTCPYCEGFGDIICSKCGGSGKITI